MQHKPRLDRTTAAFRHKPPHPEDVPAPVVFLRQRMHDADGERQLQVSEERVGAELFDLLVYLLRRVRRVRGNVLHEGEIQNKHSDANKERKTDADRHAAPRRQREADAIAVEPPGVQDRKEKLDRFADAKCDAQRWVHVFFGIDDDEIEERHEKRKEGRERQCKRITNWGDSGLHDHWIEAARGEVARLRFGARPKSGDFHYDDIFDVYRYFRKRE